MVMMHGASWNILQEIILWWYGPCIFRTSRIENGKQKGKNKEP